MLHQIGLIHDETLAAIGIGTDPSDKVIGKSFGYRSTLFHSKSILVVILIYFE